jgi:hypothetical protein
VRACCEIIVEANAKQLEAICRLDDGTIHDDCKVVVCPPVDDQLGLGRIDRRAISFAVGSKPVCQPL